ncbi:ABC transporter ATP-binding protein [Alginatibacterium sediminis]|uniref:ABC transporter ATP-binding protein n=1 Tax=Alginatibacterium sediminis TaxID=2164068 RepID=A0A420E6E7_9ALTE|nr:ABC transporter ATP-binding protein [Alginatibacterium sediminis]RKF13276.1 ABC transporter ATP-binding protein [Alginatibacterium sediminis]
MTPTPILDISGLQFAWPRQANLCLDIDSFQLNPSQHTFLQGPSGCGKSTLLSLIAGVLRPQLGEIKLLGQSINQLRPAQADRLRANHIGFIFQQFNLLPYLSVLDNVGLGCAFSKTRSQRLKQRGLSIENESMRLLEQLDIDRSMFGNPVNQLSIGQQQRVAAARAMIASPELIIADEPSSALDTQHRDHFIELLMHEASLNGSTLLFVSHDPSLAHNFEQQIALPTLNRSASHAID